MLPVQDGPAPTRRHRAPRLRRPAAHVRILAPRRALRRELPDPPLPAPPRHGDLRRSRSRRSVRAQPDLPLLRAGGGRRKPLLPISDRAGASGIPVPRIPRPDGPALPDAHLRLLRPRLRPQRHARSLGKPQPRRPPSWLGHPRRPRRGRPARRPPILLRCILVRVGSVRPRLQRRRIHRPRGGRRPLCLLRRHRSRPRRSRRARQPLLPLPRWRPPRRPGRSLRRRDGRPGPFRDQPPRLPSRRLRGHCRRRRASFPQHRGGRHIPRPHSAGSPLCRPRARLTFPAPGRRRPHRGLCLQPLCHTPSGRDDGDGAGARPSRAARRRRHSHCVGGLRRARSPRRADPRQGATCAGRRSGLRHRDLQAGRRSRELRAADAAHGRWLLLRHRAAASPRG